MWVDPNYSSSSPAQGASDGGAWISSSAFQDHEGAAAGDLCSSSQANCQFCLSHKEGAFTGCGEEGKSRSAEKWSSGPARGNLMPSFDTAVKQKLTFGDIIALRLTSVTFMTIWCAIIVQSNNYLLNKLAIFWSTGVVPNSLGSPHPSWCRCFSHISHAGPSLSSLIPPFSCPKQSGEWCWN